MCKWDVSWQAEKWMAVKNGPEAYNSDIFAMLMHRNSAEKIIIDSYVLEVQSYVSTGPWNMHGLPWQAFAIPSATITMKFVPLMIQVSMQIYLQ